MAKKKTAHIKHDYKRYIIPSVVGGAIAGIFSEDIQLGIVVFIAVFIGSWVGYHIKHK